jgi:putative chitinase
VITVEKMLTYSRLKKAEDARVHADALEDARLNSSVNTNRRLTHLLGQLFVESCGFTVMEENLKYKNAERLDAIFSAVKGVADAKALIAKGEQAIANRVYANRMGNGDEASGDGWRYRGSGYVQLTGRDNYERFGAIVNMDLVGNPELARDPKTAAVLAFAFWDAKGCSTLADNGDVDGITEKINGAARHGLVERRAATLRAINIWK